MSGQELLDRLAISELVENWFVHRDNRDWERFFEVWHDDGVMMTTWGGRWGLVLRQPIYERDFITPVDPADTVTLDPDELAHLPDGYARLGYLQAGLGYTIKRDMPTESGPELEALLAQGRRWLEGGELTWARESDS
jgi:hypothetical protein